MGLGNDSKAAVPAGSPSSLPMGTCLHSRAIRSLAGSQGILSDPPLPLGPAVLLPQVLP